MQGAQTDLFKGVAAVQTSAVVSNTPEETVVQASTTEMASSSVVQASSTSVVQLSSSSVAQASLVLTGQASSSSVAQASPTSTGEASSASNEQAVATSRGSASSTVTTSEDSKPTSVIVSSTSALGPSKASTTTNGAVKTAISKTCKRSRRRSLENHAIRLAKRNTRAFRAAAAAETVHKRAMLQDRQRLYAEGLARLDRDKAL